MQQQNNNDTPKYTNALANEQSPYLLQHAHNPVNWYPWGKEALSLAKQQDKPILISIGYAACHWCHVMEHESFENEAIAAYMNQHFVNIKVDREERPDLDAIYMDAVTTLSGQGGWPLNCFLTPDARPYFGGTYYPPSPMYNKPSWSQVLQHMHKVFTEDRQTVEDQANKLLYHISAQEKAIFASFVATSDAYEGMFEQQLSDNIYRKLKQRFDTVDGGFGGAPKFPGTMNISFLLQYHYLTKNEEALQHALFSLDKMIFGGIYDHVGGGFARYTVDKRWLIPHFEKMLYDNALLIKTIAQAYKISGKRLYIDTLAKTIGFLTRDMSNGEGGFYASYDADSEGEEGKFYVWDKKDIDGLLQGDAIIFNKFFDVTEEGNWDGKNILNRAFTYEEFGTKIGYDADQLRNLINICMRKLFAVREAMVKPGLDDKIILSWNAMLCSGLCEAYQATGEASYKTLAVDNLHFMLKAFTDSTRAKGMLLHTYKNKKAKYFAFLDDYALLIAALIDVYQITFEEDYLNKATTYLQYVEQCFSDANSPIFYYTHVEQTDVVLRKKEFYDSATPAGNSVMAINYRRMGALLGNIQYTQQAASMLKAIEDSLQKYPSSFGMWAQTALSFTYPFSELAIVGNEALEKARQWQQQFHPNTVVAASNTSNSQLNLLQNRWQAGTTLYYKCKNQICNLPVSEVKDLYFP